MHTTCQLVGNLLLGPALSVFSRCQGGQAPTKNRLRLPHWSERRKGYEIFQLPLSHSGCHYLTAPCFCYSGFRHLHRTWMLCQNKPDQRQILQRKATKPSEKNIEEKGNVWPVQDARGTLELPLKLFCSSTEPTGVRTENI